MLSLTSDFYMPAKSFRYKGEDNVITRFVALDGTHTVDVRRGKFYVKHLGATFVFDGKSWELSHFSEKQGRRSEQTDLCLCILNESYPAHDWEMFLDAQDTVVRADENETLTV